jgi:sortase (surface protein transpeptidase)
VVIPAIGVNAAVTPEGTDPSGALEMPALSSQNLAAWWDGGAAPGQDGPAVIAGHVDNASGPLVFWNLRLLKPGDRVETEPGNLIFTVTSVTQVSKDAFPTAQVYGPVKDPQLRLITCGGDFDQATGHYLDNVIVYARETG